MRKRKFPAGHFQKLSAKNSALSHTDPQSRRICRRRKPESVVAPLPCRPDVNVGNFSAGKQRGSLMIHRSGNPFQQSQPRRRPMRLNSCANRHMPQRQDRGIFADRRQNADICRIRGLSGVRRLLVRSQLTTPLTPSGRRVSRIFWKMTAPLKPLSGTPHSESLTEVRADPSFPARSRDCRE